MFDRCVFWILVVWCAVAMATPGNLPYFVERAADGSLVFGHIVGVVLALTLLVRKGLLKSI